LIVEAPSSARKVVWRPHSIMPREGQDMEQFANPSAEVVLHPAEYRTGELRYPLGPAKQ